MVMGQDVILGDREIPVENLEKLPLDPAHVPFAKDTGAQRPVNVPEGRIVGVLEGADHVRMKQQKAKNAKQTLAAKISAPRNTRSQAHCSVAMER